MRRTLLTSALALFCIVSVVAFSPTPALAAPGDYCWAAGKVPGHYNSAELCVPDDMPIGQSCGPGYHADPSGNCVEDASYSGQSCVSGYHADSSGNCVKDASYDGQSCATGYQADSSGNCVASQTTGTPPDTAGISPATTGTGGVKQNPAAGSGIKPSGSSSNGIDITYLKRYSDSIIGVINGIVVPVLFALAFLFFLYGVFKYFILKSDSDTERQKGRDFVLWGVIGFAVILSVWGLVNLVLNTFMLSPGGAPPQYPLL